MDDGLSLDKIVGMLRGFLPTISYYVNLVNRLFDVFTSYIGFGSDSDEGEVTE